LVVLAVFVYVLVSVKATDCESDIYDEPLAASAVRFGVFTANGELVLVPIVPDETSATVFAAVAVYELPPVMLPLAFRNHVPVDVFAPLVYAPVSVNVTACESDIYELVVASAVRFGVFTANVDVRLVPIVPDDTSATVLPATAVYVPPDVMLPLAFKNQVPLLIPAELV